MASSLKQEKAVFQKDIRIGYSSTTLPNKKFTLTAISNGDGSTDAMASDADVRYQYVPMICMANSNNLFHKFDTGNLYLRRLRPW